MKFCAHLFLMFILVAAAVAQPKRPYPYPVVPDKNFRDAIEAGTRTADGVPGPKYWQNTAEYAIHARLIPELKRLEGQVSITYHNESPDTLKSLRLAVLQNIHREGASRLTTVEVTGGYEYASIAVNGERLITGRRSGARYMEQGTTLILVPSTPTPPGGVAKIDIDYAFKIPQKGISARMGYDTDSLFYIAYWYPEMLVYNDVVGWEDDQFLGGAEFYFDNGTYDYTLDVPDDWRVWGTGDIQNLNETYSDEVLKRLAKAKKSDETVRIVGPEDFATATRKGNEGWLTWKLKASKVRDIAWLATRSSIWEAARIDIGGGKYAMAHSFWRPTAPKWKRSVEFTQKTISFLSRYTGVQYPWPHMTAVESDGIMGGGMEFPMMTLIGGYNRGASDMGLLGVHAHEEAHMWVPMIVMNDERRYSWMDEGTTSFHTDEILHAVVPDSVKKEDRFNGYLGIAKAEGEGEIMRWSNFHYNGWAYGVASYAKPASILQMLKGVLGEDMFLKAFRTYLNTWAGKHPYPWDMFNSFSHVSGKNLDWFMRSWYYETWTLDQAVGEVKETPDGTRITIVDKGWVPMPVLLTVTRKDGSKEDLRISEQAWLAGKTETSVTVKKGSPVVKVEIDPNYYFADLDRTNNTWNAPE